MATTLTHTPAATTFSRPSACEIPERFDQLRVHMVGIGGCGMSGLAHMLMRRGAVVTGSDLRASMELTRLAERGAKVCTNQSADAIPHNATLVVISAAIQADHPERLEAHRRGVPVIRYAELLGQLMKRQEGVAIAGTHGKSTTTAWLAYTLKSAGLDPTFIVGATVEQLDGGSGVGDGPHFLAEACEYEGSFLQLRPRVGVILNIEEDHLDYYKDVDAIQQAFAAFAARVPTDGLLVINGDDLRCHEVAGTVTCPTETVGVGPDVTWRASRLEVEDGRYAFDVHQRDQRRGRVHLGLPGRHNVDNALAVIAVAHRAGVPWDAISEGLATFRGARRRLELRGTPGGIRVLDDYAHHPTEIRATLQAARQRYRPRRLWCIFQPHQHSRTRFLLTDFARSFSDADEVIVPDIYFVRDSQRERELVCAQDLVDAICFDGGRARHIGDFDAITELLANAVRRDDVIITMGAGNIWRVADAVVQRLGADLPA